MRKGFTLRNRITLFLEKGVTYKQGAKERVSQSPRPSPQALPTSEYRAAPAL
jgi:hypothetical protein